MLSAPWSVVLVVLLRLGLLPFCRSLLLIDNDVVDELADLPVNGVLWANHRSGCVQKCECPANCDCPAATFPDRIDAPEGLDCQANV